VTGAEICCWSLPNPWIVVPEKIGADHERPKLGRWTTWPPLWSKSNTPRSSNDAAKTKQWYSSPPSLLWNHLANPCTQLSYNDQLSPLFYATFILAHLLQNQLFPPFPSPFPLTPPASTGSSIDISGPVPKQRTCEHQRQCRTRLRSSTHCPSFKGRGHGIIRDFTPLLQRLRMVRSCLKTLSQPWSSTINVRFSLLRCFSDMANLVGAGICQERTLGLLGKVYESIPLEKAAGYLGLTNETVFSGILPLSRV